MHPYVAFLQRSPSASKFIALLKHAFQELHSDWLTHECGRCLTLYYMSAKNKSSETFMLPAGRDAVLGTLFPRDLEVSPQGWQPSIDEVLIDDIIRTKGGRLMEDFWGGYVAFLRSRDDSTQYVLRDCSAKVPCYLIALADVVIVTSDIEYLSKLSLPRFSINRQFLAGFIYDAELSQRECGLNEVTELLSGECFESTARGVRQFAAWNPRAVVRKPFLQGFEDASRQVQATTQACVDFWASKYDRIVHLLSGGLDSSVVLACLKQSPHQPHVTCLHFEAGGSDGTERRFAELAAHNLGFDLIVQPGYSRGALYDERIFRLPRSPKPNVSNLGLAIESDMRNVVPSSVRAQAIWDGQGGDHIFFQTRSTFAAVDYAFDHGLRHEFLAHVHSVLRRSRLSYWGVLGKSFRLGLFKGRWHPENEYERDAIFLHPAAVPSDLNEYIWQTWSDQATDLPPGKRWQIRLLASVLHRHRPVPGLQYASEHHPLFSQPLVELCLRIPLYTLLQGGGDRALERHAFRLVVPPQIIQRENKGTTSTTFMSKVRECLPFIRDLILDGVLVQERIVDRKSIEPYLVGNRPVDNTVLWPFLSCMAAEVWARKWSDASWRI